MPKHATLSVALEADLHAALLAEARAADRPAADVVRELVEDFVERRRTARDYDGFVENKVAAARAARQAGDTRPHEAVEAEAAAWRRSILES